MSDQYPRPIDSREIRAGDEVKQAAIYNGVTTTKQFVCEEIFENAEHEPYIRAVKDDEFAWGTEIRIYHGAKNITWELISRPEPAREPWSQWWDDDTETGWVRTDRDEPFSDNYTQVRGSSTSNRMLEIGYAPDQEIIDRLVPYTGQDKTLGCPEGTITAAIRRAVQHVGLPDAARIVHADHARLSTLAGRVDEG